MRIAFLNPQGNFDPNDNYWTEHPDFGGQLVYVKQVALAMGELGHQVAGLKLKSVGHIEQLINKELLYNQVEENLINL